MATQIRNDEMVALLSSDLQPRYEPNFAWKSACSSFLALPGLRGFWPMSVVGYAQPECKDISGNGNHLQSGAALGDVPFSYDTFLPGLAPVAEFGGALNQVLYKADGGAANWADIRGTETYIASGERGLTIGGWFYVMSTAVGGTGLIGKYTTTGNQRSYLLYITGAAFPSTFVFVISTDGISTVQTAQSAPTVNRWYFLVGRFVPSTSVDLWVNGTKSTLAVGVPASIFDSTAIFEMPSFNSGNFRSTCNASMCFLCASALSDSIISALFQQTRAMYGV